MRVKFRGVTAGSAVVLAVAGCMALTRPAPAADEPRRIEITAKRFTFEPAEITVKKGEAVDLVFHSEDVTHGIKFKELDLQTEISKDESELKFTADKAGDFIGHCSHFCGVGHGSMTLTLHVTE
ncbi:MAG TPA: cupredoxin domain-containing protein [Acidobacteriaceae bacterium]